jgi:GTP:adenosylcobinamide-phosphate guanylyltransferase
VSGSGSSPQALGRLGDARSERRPAPQTRPVVVACIPAYNEEKTLGDVIAVLRQVPEIERIVVISDGSTDRTAEVARQSGAVCIELQQNVGKGGALKMGIEQADADVYLFLDADLIGLTPQHVRDLLDPVLHGEVQMTLGILEHGRVATDLAHVVAPFLSGQRAVTKAVLEGVSGMETARYGIEVAINRHLRKYGMPVRFVAMENLTHRTKEEKLGLWRGFVARLRMYWEIVKYAGEAANPFGE